MPSAPSKGMPPGYAVPDWAPRGWTGPVVVPPPVVVLPSAARVVLPSERPKAPIVPPWRRPKAAPATPPLPVEELVPPQPAFPPPQPRGVETVTSDSDSSESVYDSAGRKMVNKGAGRSRAELRAAKPSSKVDRITDDIVDALVGPQHFEEFDDFFEDVLDPRVKVEPKFEPIVAPSSKAPSFCIKAEHSKKEEDSDEEPVAKKEEDSDEEPVGIMAPRAKAAPPAWVVKAEWGEPPPSYAKRLRTTELQGEASSSSGGGMAEPVDAEPRRPSRAFFA